MGRPKKVKVKALNGISHSESGIMLYYSPGQVFSIESSIAEELVLSESVEMLDSKEQGEFKKEIRKRKLASRPSIPKKLLIDSAIDGTAD